MIIKMTPPPPAQPEPPKPQEAVQPAPPKEAVQPAPPKEAAPAPAAGNDAPRQAEALPLFTGTAHCTARVHCAACLAPDRLFRQAMAKRFSFPGGDIGFACPHGMTVEEAKRLKEQRKPGEAALPSMLERAASLAKAGGRVFKAVIGGQEVEVERPVYLSRLAQCFSCPSKQFRPSDQTCAECGCFVRKKAALATEVCKFGYWQIRSSQPPPVDNLVLTPVIIMEQKDRLLAAVPPGSKVAEAIKSHDTEAAKPDGCSGCQKRRLQAQVASALIDELPGYGGEVRAAIRALFPKFERISDNRGVHPFVTETPPSPAIMPRG